MNIPHFAIPDGYEEFFDEIAGILQFDARMGLREAESTALRIVYAMHKDTQSIGTNDDK